MEFFRFVPPQVTVTVALGLAALFTAVNSYPFPQTSTRFLPGLPALPPSILNKPQLNPNQQTQNTLAFGGLAAVGGATAFKCLSGQNCDIKFRPNIGGALNANGQFVPQAGISAQFGEGLGATQLSTGLQFNQNNQNNPLGTFITGGVGTGDSNGFSPSVETGFGFQQANNGQTQAVSQVGANINTPSFGGLNFNNRPGSIGGVQPTLFNNPIFSGLLQG